MKLGLAGAKLKLVYAARARFAQCLASRRWRPFVVFKVFVKFNDVIFFFFLRLNRKRSTVWSASCVNPRCGKLRLPQRAS